MALAKQAKVISVEKWNEWTCRVACEMATPEPLRFTGGQYIIVNSGIPLPNGKMGKRAYSIPSPDSDSKGFELVVRRIPGGTGSGFIHSLVPGEAFEFSGPWGKYLPPATHENLNHILVVATDTGLTAALGLVNGRNFSRFLSSTQLIWFVESDTYFTPPSFLKEHIPHGLQWKKIWIPKVGDDSRVDFCKGCVSDLFEKDGVDRVYLSGDGKVLLGLEDSFLTHGYRKDQIVTETFFNHKELKTANVS